MMKNLLTNLPEDVLITNILLNSKVLPVKSLLSLRCVCKYLRNLITSPVFIKMQLHHSTTNQLLNNNPLVLIKATQRPDVFFSLKFNGGDPCRPGVVELVSPVECSNIWGSCNGLVCLAKRDNLCLWNPFTKEYKVVPPPLPSLIMEIPMGLNATQVSLDFGGSITYGFGYDRILDDYKIVRCSEHFGGPRFDDNGNSHIPITEFQVYTLGTNTWRNINNNPYNSHFVLSLPMKHKSVVFVNGALHWIMSISNWYMAKSTEMPAEAKIVSFNIEKEVFQEIQTPLMAKFNPRLYFLPVIQVLRGCLCLLEHDSSTETFCNVWMMIDYGVGESWTKIFTILRAEVSPRMMLPSSYRLLRFCENGTEIIMGSYNTILVYDLINNKARHLEFGEKLGKCMYQSEVYIESLVSLNSGVYKGEMRIQSKMKKVSNYKGEMRIQSKMKKVSNYKGKMRIQSKMKKVSKQGWKGSGSTRLLGDMAWDYMQKENYYMAEQLYSKALSIEPDKNKQCNLAICLMNSGRIPEAKSLLQEVVNPSFVEHSIADSYIKSYNRAWKILTERESQSVLNYPPLPHHAPYQQQFFQPLYFQPTYPMFNGVYPVVSSLDPYYQNPQQYYQHFNHPHMVNPYMFNPYQGFDHHPRM